MNGMVFVTLPKCTIFTMRRCAATCRAIARLTRRVRRLNTDRFDTDRCALALMTFSDVPLHLHATRGASPARLRELISLRARDADAARRARRAILALGTSYGPREIARLLVAELEVHAIATRDEVLRC
jgi:hypothetical protein